MTSLRVLLIIISIIIIPFDQVDLWSVSMSRANP